MQCLAFLGPAACLTAASFMESGPASVGELGARQHAQGGVAPVWHHLPNPGRAYMLPLHSALHLGHRRSYRLLHILELCLRLGAFTSELDVPACPPFLLQRWSHLRWASLPSPLRVSKQLG